MPSYTLTYFTLKALGEGIRLLLSHGGVEFKDVRISSEEWPQMKSSLVYGQLPVLEIDGKVYAQSSAIYRMLGKKFGLTGDDDLEAFEIDQIFELVTDLRLEASSAFYEDDETAKADKYANLKKDEFPFLLSKLDQAAGANNGYLANGKLSWADFAFTGMCDYLSHMIGLDIGEEYSNLKKVNDNVLALPSVKKFYETAPETIF